MFEWIAYQWRYKKEMWLAIAIVFIVVCGVVYYLILQTAQPQF